MAKEDVFKKAFNEVLVFDVNGDGAFSRHELFSYDPQLRASTISNAKEGSRGEIPVRPDLGIEPARQI